MYFSETYLKQIRFVVCPFCFAKIHFSFIKTKKWLFFVDYLALKKCFIFVISNKHLIYFLSAYYVFFSKHSPVEAGN